MPRLRGDDEKEKAGEMSFRNASTKSSAPESTVQSGHRAVATTTRRRAIASRLLEDGEIFGKYQVVRWIARGGMSEVYEAVHIGLRKPVALKVLRGELAEHAEARDRFALEGNNAALVRHPNVVDVSDVGVVDDIPFLVMELLEGDSLAEVLSRVGSMPTAEAVDLLLPVIAAVSAAHDHGVIHRDLKPDNIFLQYEGPRIVPKVLDFGASRVMDRGRLTVNASVLGTPHYMSPEQARGESGTDARSDQHALGVILYEAVVGCLPRDASDPLELLHQVAYGPFRRPSELMELPDGLEAVIVRAMARDPSQRFATTRDFGLALLPFASEASREYWSMELRHPSMRRSVDIAQPAVSSRRFTPGSAVQAPLPDSSDVPALIVVPEAGTRMLPSSRPPPALLHPETAGKEGLAAGKPSSKRRLLAGSAVLAAVVAAVFALAPREGGRAPVAAVSGAPSPAARVAEPAPSAEPAPEIASAAPAESAAPKKAAPASRRAAASPPRKAEPVAAEPAPARAVAVREAAPPKVRVIEEAKPKVEIIE